MFYLVYFGRFNGLYEVSVYIRFKKCLSGDF